MQALAALRTAFPQVAEWQGTGPGHIASLERTTG
jgi:hypothetical protein